MEKLELVCLENYLLLVNACAASLLYKELGYWLIVDEFVFFYVPEHTTSSIIILLL